MTHIDPENLAIIALAGADLTAAERQHLTRCPGCALELLSLQHTVIVGQAARNVSLTEPAEAVWERIHGALGLSAAVKSTPRRDQFVGATPAAATNAPEPAQTRTSRDHLTATRARTLVDLAPRRRRWLPVSLAAALVGLIAGLAGGIWFDSLQHAAAPTVIYQAQLTPFPGWQAHGQASVKESADGHRNVTVDLTAPATPDSSLREVWLIKADASGLISIGLLDGNTGRFDIPDTVDLTQYPLVDISAQPNNGNPAHSGNTIVRGHLQAS
ncbi:anti-sigma factor [Cryobacterium sp. RTC2.1]|uniref:anti-sigma factor n=1 Tax=Cryobacterium sp. RTC2.1 TaxID=3048634 RepID=UPI002B23374E|nr:anti-sigma factor [Cryobacterium sp. RTC2.1]MEB0003508.1 anti-sigma factor [Cryobacterium sp. RTC2.1]